MTPQDMQQFSDLIEAKLCELLLDLSDWLIPRVKRYLSRTA